ncbi:hypothetical protein ACC736_38845, partial [Rhizobium ruizarguesonis]
YCITQVVADPDSPAFKMAETVRVEWVIRIDGLVKARTDDTVNKTWVRLTMFRCSVSRRRSRKRYFRRTS